MWGCAAVQAAWGAERARKAHNAKSGAGGMVTAETRLGPLAGLWRALRAYAVSHGVLAGPDLGGNLHECT